MHGVSLGMWCRDIARALRDGDRVSRSRRVLSRLAVAALFIKTRACIECEVVLQACSLMTGWLGVATIFALNNPG